MSVQLAAQDFATPDKGGPNNMTASTMDASYTQHKGSVTQTTSKAVSTHSVTPMETGQKDPNSSTKQPNTVTPHGSHPTAGGKQVRFGAEETKDAKPVPAESPANAKRGPVSVSRRGGRFVSPARSVAANTSAPSSAPAPSGTVAPKEQSVLEYTTFRPAAKSDNDSTPTLSSANSVGLVSMPSESEKDNEHNTGNSSTKKGKTEGSFAVDSRRPTSISYGQSNLQTSPLAKSSPQKECPSFDDEAKSLIRSPVPTQSYERYKKTPTRSPSGQFHTLPSLDDAQLQSPGGIFLSPHPPTPQQYKSAERSFDHEDHKEEKHDDIKQEKIRDYSKDKFALTPTNFSVDYGKGDFGSLDTSNVLNWLQSPTANGLFSPGGGLNSIMNTPKGPIMPRTPGTPTSQSFFFSDVAGLPRDGDNTPQRGGDEKSKNSKKGISNIICISPLASSRHRNGNQHQANTPINYNDIFASPNPLLDDSPVKSMLRARGGGNGKNPSLDAVHHAERDLMQDEDLNVLLQLAGSNTPKAAKSQNASGGHVFRGSGSRKGGGDSNDRENLPALQLPVIGDRDTDSSAARLLRKSHSREHGGNDSFVSPQLAVRQSNSSAQPKSVPSSSSATKAQHPDTKLMQRDSKAKADLPGSSSNKSTSSGQPSYQPPARAPSYPPRPPSQEMYGFSSMPPHGMRPTGRMSVVVGGPPPSSRAPKSSPAQSRHMGASPQHRPHPGYSQPDAYPPPGMSYPPPHGHYPHHPVHMNGMGGHPYHSHYGAPRAPHPAQRMPMYGQHPAPSLPPSGKKQGKQSTASSPAAGKAPQKRPSLTPAAGDKIAKKQKKAGAAPKKRKSPPMTDQRDRQKAAQSIACMNAASGGKNDKAAALAAAILRGVTMRPSGKWQAQLYFAGKSRYIGVFDTREKAALAYEIAREKLKAHKDAADGPLTPKQTENAVNAARKAAFDGVNEQDPRNN